MARVWVRVEVRVRMRVEVGVSVSFRVGVGLVSPSSACSALKTLGAPRAPDVAPSAAPSSWLALALRSPTHLQLSRHGLAQAAHNAEWHEHPDRLRLHGAIRCAFPEMTHTKNFTLLIHSIPRTVQYVL